MATVLTPAEIKQKIEDWITSLGGHEITGAHLNAILSAIMDYVGVGFAFKDSAPAAAPSSDVPVVYIAGPGTYTGYENDAVEVPVGSVCIFKYDGSDWSKSVLKIHEPVSVSQNDIAISLESGNVVKSIRCYLQPSQDYDIVLSNGITSSTSPYFWVVSFDSSGNSTLLTDTLDSTRKVRITVPADSVVISINMRSTTALDLNVSIRKVKYAWSADDAIKEMYINTSFAEYDDFGYIALARGAKIFSADNKWYEGIYYSLNGDFGFVGNIYTNEQDALNACVGIKIYSNDDNTLLCVVDWSKTSYSATSRASMLTLLSNFNSLSNKPIISSYIESLKNVGVKETINNIKPAISGDRFNINLSLTANVAKSITCYLQKGQSYIIRVNKSLTGSYPFWVVSFDSSGSYTILSESLDSQRSALINVPDNSDRVVISFNSSQDSDIMVSVTKMKFVTDANEAVKELYISPTLALYSNITGIWLARGVKIYGDRNEWYEGIYMYANGVFTFATNIYNSEDDAKNACEGIKVYSNQQKTLVAVIDWSKVEPSPANTPALKPIADHNNLANKPIITNFLSEINGGDSWINRYPQLLDKLPVFANKIYNHEDVNIVMLGDSFFAAQITCALNVNAANLPPQCARNHTQFQIWNRLCFNKPQYDRWDSQVNAFTETGTFSESGATFPSIWDTEDMTEKMQAKNTGVALDRFSDDNNASIAFTWDMSAYERLNFIYRKSNNINETDIAIGTSSALVTISEGNGKALVYNGSAWVEANGYAFSMRIAETGDGYAETMPDVKLKFKKVTTDTIHIVISNSANDGLLYYWGTERWNGGSLFITNIARGGFNSYWLNQNIINDLGERDCDLLIYELPLTNDSYVGLSTAISRNTHIIEGGGETWQDTANFKALSDNFTKFDLLCVVPHIGTRYIVSNSNTFKPKDGEPSITYKQYFDAMRGLMETLQVPYIPLYKDWLDTSRNNYDNYYVAGVDRQIDDVHPNDKGCAIYASVIEPAIEI